MATNINTVIDNLMSVLGGIDGTGSFKTSVTKIQRWADPVVKHSKSEMPLIMLRPVNIEADHYAPARIRHNLTVILHCVVTDATPELAQEKLADLCDDIIFALNVDHYRGSTSGVQNAMDTFVNGILFEEYTPDNTVCSAMVTVNVIYHRSTESS